MVTLTVYNRVRCLAKDWWSASGLTLRRSGALQSAVRPGANPVSTGGARGCLAPATCYVAPAKHVGMFNIANQILGPKSAIAHSVAQPFFAFNKLL
jgi:hypothetical protein